MSDPQWLTIPEIVRAAHSTLSANVWDFSCGGAESETTLRRNRAGFDEIAFRPRALRGVAHRSTATKFLGFDLALPVMFAPVGSIALFDPNGALAVARVADRVGTIPFVGALNRPSMQDVRAGSDGPLFFQIYVRGDRPWMEALIRRAEDSGYSGLALTVDNATYSRRERDLHNRYLSRSEGGSGGGQPNLQGLPEPTGTLKGAEYQADLTWEDVEWMKQVTKLPVMLKGIQDGEDAALAVQHGADVVYVSNHGGRQIDHAPGCIDVLPEVVRSVNGKAEVIIDGGFMRGSDVIKAVAIGAKAVCIGKLMAWGLAAGGEAGLECAMDILKTEITINMGNLGVSSISELTPDCLRPATPPPADVWPVGENPAAVAVGSVL